MKPDTPARAARKAAGYRSAAQVAKRLRCSAEKVLQAERDGGRPTYDTIYALTEIYGCSSTVFTHQGGKTLEDRSERSK